MKSSVFFFLFFSYINSNSQILFEKYYGTIGKNNVGFYVQEISNGFIVGGSSDNDGIIIRTNSMGDSLWQQNYLNGTVESLRSSGNGSFMLAGTDYNSPYKAVFRQVDSSGNILWDTITSSNPFTMYGLASIQTPDSNFAVLENDNYPFQEYLRIRKISGVSDTTIWTKDISKVSSCNSSSFQLTFDSSIVVANGAFDTPYPRLILSKTFPNGVFDWRKDYFFIGDTGIVGNSVVQLMDSGFVVIGYKVFGNPQADYRLFLMKTDAYGDSLWTKEYNLNNSNSFPDIIQTSDGGYALIGTITYPPQSGNFDYRIMLMKTDNNGDSMWTREFTGYGLNDAKKIIQTSDGGFAIIGTSTDQNINQNYLYLIKTDSLGRIIHTALPCNPILTATIPDKCNPTTNFVTVTSFGSLPNDYYWYTSSGTLLQTDTGRTFMDTISSLPFGLYYVVVNDSGICGIDTLNFLIPDAINFHVDSIRHTSCIGCADGILYFTIHGGFPPYTFSIPFGNVSGNTIIGLNAGTYTITAMDDSLCSASNQATVLDDPTLIPSIFDENNFLIFPNPVLDMTAIRFRGKGIVTIKLIDINGKLIKTILNENLNPGIHELTFDCKKMAEGFYTLELCNELYKRYKKLIIYK